MKELTIKDETREVPGKTKECFLFVGFYKGTVLLSLSWKGFLKMVQKPGTIRGSVGVISYVKMQINLFTKQK